MPQDATFDTSFWVNAYRADLLPSVLQRFVLRYAPVVAVELPETNPPGREFHRLARLGIVQEVSPATVHVREFGAGERNTMSIALEHADWALLIDDYRPYHVAVERGIRALCSPDLAVTLYHEGAIPEEQLLTVLIPLSFGSAIIPGAASATLRFGRAAGIMAEVGAVGISRLEAIRTVSPRLLEQARNRLCQ